MLNKVFIIDDDEVNNFVCERLIKNANLTKNVGKYETAREALNDLKFIVENGESEQYFPEIIFLDINMPYMDGWDFLEEFKKFPREYTNKCGIYMLSSSINKQDIDKAKGYQEVIDYITKPLTMDVLNQLNSV